MSVDTIVQIVIAAVGTILVPCVIYLVQAVIYLVRAISRLNETMTRLEERIVRGVEPRIVKCEGDIGALYDRTNEHGKDIAALKEATRHT